MRILAVLPVAPYPPDQGDRLRAWDMLQALVAQGEVTLVLLLREPPEHRQDDYLRSITHNLLVCHLARVDLALAAIRGIMTGTPPAVAAYWCGRCSRQVEDASRGGWDLAVAMQLRAAPYVINVNARIKALELTDSLSLYQRQLNWRRRTALRRLSLFGAGRLEQRLATHFDRVWVSSERDANWCDSRLGFRPTVVPNGCRPLRKPVCSSPDGPLLFMGNMRYPPNEDGAVWFAKEVWPLVHSQRAGLRLRIVGRPTPRVLALARVPGVEVAGYVAEIGAELAAARALVNPVRWGTGTNRKVLDAWAYGLPVISSAAGIRGLAAEDGIHVLVADGPAQWAERVAWMYAEPEAAARLGRAGWRLAVDRYQTDQVWRRAMVELAGFGGDPDGRG